MSAAGPLRQIDRQRYRELLRRLLPQALGVTLIDAQGDAVWADGVAVPRTGLALVPGPGAAADAGGAARAEGCATAHYASIGEDQFGRSRGSLAVLHEVREGESGVSEALELVAGLIGEECRLNGELESMAEELANRYEELNLVYDTDDQVARFDDQENVFRQLVSNCVEYLDVDLAALIVPGKRIEVHQARRGLIAALAQIMVKDLEADFGASVIERGEGIVVNSAGDAQRHGGRIFMNKVLCVPVFSGDRVDGVLAVVKGVQQPDFTNSDRNLLEVLGKKASKVIQASYDVLTGLLKRPGFEFYLAQALRAVRERGVEYSILDVDIDRLRIVNDHDRGAGDALIRQIATVVCGGLRESDVVASYGGGRFGVLLEKCPLAMGRRVAEKVRATVHSGGFDWEGQHFEVSVSIGVAELSGEVSTIDELFTNVEMATGAAKEQGRDQVQVFERSDERLARRRDEMGWVGRIQGLLRDGGFLLYSQPIAALQTRQDVDHWEILLRATDEEGRIVAPGAFMPAAERYQLMPAVDRWVIRATLDALADCRARLAGRAITWSINLSGQSIGEGLLDFITGELRRSGVPAGALCFEVTESEAAANIEEAKRFIQALQVLGCRFSLDDFGTGFSSFSYLRSLPVDYLKIDGSFVREVDRDPISSAMVSAIHQVGRIVGTRTIAEFVEGEAVCEHLRGLGVDFAQGYGIGKPCPLRDTLDAMPGCPASALSP